VKADGTYAVEPDTGIVLVLVPGGAFDMGAQHASPDEPNFDPAATAIEWTSHAEHPSTLRRRLWPFLLSKYEMTQAQWRRLTGRDPSACTPSSVPLHVRSDAHPVENVTWTECMQVMQQVGLALPTEAQWEYAARAGTRSPWWTGVDRSSLEGAANIADHRAAVEGAEFKSEWSDWPELDDGFALHAQVGSLRPNPFGLHDVCGNVSEWCRDAGATTYDAAAEIKIGTLERIHGDEGLRAHRGGSYMLRAAACRSSARAFNGPTRALPDIGLRPARDLDR
jgi:formylglycine-generating enzyme required for sulfatase activity